MSIEQQSSPPAKPTPNTPLSMVKPTWAPAAVDTSAPIRPEWLRDKGAFLTTSRLWARRNGYRALQWLFHLPVFVALLVLYSPRGAARLVARLAKWVYDQDSADLRHQHATDRASSEYARVSAVRKANLHARLLVFGTTATVLVGPLLAWTFPGILAAFAGALVMLWTIKVVPGKSAWEVVGALAVGVAVFWWLPSLLVLLPRPAIWAIVDCLAVVVLALGWAGRPQGKTLGAGSKFAAPSELVKPTADLVVDALVAAVPGITEKNRDTIRVHAPGVARARQGYHISLELPPGSTVSDVMEQREELAAALRRQLGCCWPAKAPMHPGHMRLFIGDEPMATAAQARWKLADGKKVDIFDALPLFTDQEGRWVDLSIMYKALVIGGAPGFGKTYGVRAIGAAVALDPRVRIVTLDGKANGDLRPFRLVADGYYEDDDDPGIAEQLVAIEDIRNEMRRRAKFLRDLPPAENPEGKVTSALVDKYPHLAPIVLIIDEVQVYTEHEDKKIREAFIAAAADIVRRGRSAGIVPVFCTQKPTADVLPTSIVDNCSVRLCFKVNGQRANDAVLGNEMHSSGIKATKFGPDDKGLAWLKGDGAEPIVVRTVFGFDKLAAEALLAKARALREAAGLLTGYAAGDEQEPVQVSLLDDLRDVMDHPPVKALTLGELRESLADLRPQTWGHLDNPALGAMLREAGIRVGTVWSSRAGKDGKGCRREWLDGAATADEALEERPVNGVVVDLTR